MEITTVLLDAGGVILDESEHEEVRAGIIVDVLREVVPAYSEKQYLADVATGVDAFCPNIYEYVFWKNVKGDLTLFEGLYTRHTEIWKELRPPLALMRGIEDELRTLNSHFKVAIAGQYGKEILTLLEQNSILDCFSHHLTQDDFPITKPDPRYYEQIAKAIGVKPEQCIMVGDRVDKDVVPAKQVGMKTIRIRVGLHKNQEPRIPSEVPDAELASITGLAETALRLAAASAVGDDRP